MLERETELIKQIIVESTINNRSAVKVYEVVAADLPRGVKAFVVAETMKLLAKDFRQSPNLSKITASVAQTVTTERTLLRSLAMEYVFQREEYLKLVEDAVHFLENYLCRPQWTLYQLMFEHEQKISFGRLVSQFEYVVDYGYFRELIERYARRNNWAEIEADNFKDLIVRIDQEVLKHHSPRELASMTKPIFDFLLFGDTSMNRPIPLGAILLFFEDKNLNSVKEYIDRICQIRSRTQISMNELLSIIEDLYLVETTVKEEVEESQQAIFAPQNKGEAPEAESVVEMPATTPTIETSIIAENVEPLAASLEEQTPSSVESLTQPSNSTSWNNLEPAFAAESAHNVEAIETVPSTRRADQVTDAHLLLSYAQERDALRRSLLLTFPGQLTDDADGSELADVDSFITEAQRSTFIKKIFRNDETNYSIFIASLNKAQTWRDAQVHLRDLFQVNKLDLLSPDVVEFTDAMHSRYAPDLKPKNEVY